MVKKIISIFVFFVMAIFGLVLFVGTTQTGLDVAVYLAKNLSPGELRIANASGELFSDVTFTDVKYITKYQTASISSLHIVWSPLKLFNRKIVLDDIAVKNIRVVQTGVVDSESSSATQATNPFELIAFLDWLHVKRLTLDELVYKQKANEYKLSQVMLTKDSQLGYKLVATILDGKVSVDLAPNFKNDKSWQLLVSVDGINVKKLFPDLDGKISFDLSSDGLISEDDKRFNIDIKKINGKISGFPVTGRFGFQYGNNIITIPSSELKIANASIKVSGKADKNWDLSWQVSAPALSKISDELGGSLSTSGTVSGKRDRPIIKGVLSAKQLRFDEQHLQSLNANVYLDPIDPSTLKISAQKYRYASFEVPSIKFDLAGQIQRNQMISKIKLNIGNKNTISGQFILEEFTSFFDLKQPITADLDVDWKGLSQFIRSDQYLSNFSGVLTGKVGVEGTLLYPLVKADLMLKNGKFDVPKTKTSVRNLQANLGLTNKRIKIMSELKAGDGQMKIAGEFNHKKTWQGKLTIISNNLLVANSSEYRVYADTDLAITHENNQMELTGTITIPKADIAPTDYSSVETLPDDVIFVDTKKTDEESAPTSKFAMDIKVKLGDKVKLRYSNLDASIIGELSVSQKPNSPAVGNGRLTLVKGLYSAYGHKLTLDKSELIYTGNVLTNPNLNISAARTIKRINMSGGGFGSGASSNQTVGSMQNLIVGLSIKGTANQPRLDFYSKPSGLSQNDIMSYLLLGYPQSQADGQGQYALASLASSLAFGDDSKKDSIFPDLSGLDFDIGSTEIIDPGADSPTSVKTFGVGKKLSDNLYLNYNMGIFTPVAILNIRYILSRRFSVQTEASTIEDGVDLLYQLERK